MANTVSLKGERSTGCETRWTLHVFGKTALAILRGFGTRPEGGQS